MDGTPINIGQILEAQMHHCAARTAEEMFFPSLITFMCHRVAITSSVSQQVPYIAGTITLVDLRRLLPVSAPTTSQPPVTSDSSTSNSAATSSDSITASLSSTTTPPSDPGDAADSASAPTAPLPSSPIDVSDTAMPDISLKKSSAPTRRSNWVRARIISPSSRKSSSSRLPAVRKRVLSPVGKISLVAPLDLVLPALRYATPTPTTIFKPPVPTPDGLPAPSTHARTFTVPPPPSVTLASTPTPSPSAQHPLRNTLVDILHTLSDNQGLFFDYVLAKDQHLQILFEQLFHHLFGIAPSLWPLAPNYRSTPNPSTNDPPPET